MELNEKIKRLRLEQGLTLEQVGNMVGVGKSTVRKWESGQIENMRRDKISKLAAALNTTPSYLMGWEGFNDTFNDIIQFAQDSYHRQIEDALAPLRRISDKCISEAIDGADFTTPENVDMQFSLRLKQIRKENQRTLKELAKAVGVVESTFSQYENGKRKPDFDTLVKIADYYNCSVDYLLGRVDRPELVIKKLPSECGDGEYAIPKNAPELTTKEIMQLKEFLTSLNSNREESDKK